MTYHVDCLNLNWVWRTSVGYLIEPLGQTDTDNKEPQ